MKQLRQVHYLFVVMQLITQEGGVDKFQLWNFTNPKCWYNHDEDNRSVNNRIILCINTGVNPCVDLMLKELLRG
jgi:hypothetical protein